MPSNVWYKEPETVAAHYYILLRLFQCRFAYDRTLLLSFLRMVKRTCLPHTKPLSAPCLKRVSENWQLVKLIRLLVILLPSDVFSQRELLICFSRNEKSFASICTRNVQPTHLGNDSFDSISQFFSLSLLHFNSFFFFFKKKIIVHWQILHLCTCNYCTVSCPSYYVHACFLKANRACKWLILTTPYENA